jgi:hypothetical protein
MEQLQRDTPGSAFDGITGHNMVQPVQVRSATLP